MGLEAGRRAFIRNFKGFMAIFGKSRKGLAGLTIILFFLLLAVLAPLLTPYNPQHTIQLANFRARPEWLDPNLPRNLYPILDPGFRSEVSLSEWNVNASSARVEWTKEDGYPGIPGIEEGSGPGSIIISATNGQFRNVDAELLRAFDYPYSPPRRVSAHIAYKAEVQGEASYSIQVLLQQPSGARLLLWDSGTRDEGTGWTVPRPSIDSNEIALRLRLFKDALADASLLLPSKGDYQLVVLVSESLKEASSAQVFIDDVEFRVWGEAFGLLGTDNYGRDIFTQLAHGARISIIVGLLASFIAVSLGLLVGLVSGYLGGVVDEALMRGNDMLLTIPALPLLIILLAVTGANVLTIVAFIGVLSWMGIARLIRSQVLSLKQRAFVEAARAIGGGSGHIMLRHLVPNVMTMAYTQLALTVPAAIVTEAALSFLGLFPHGLQTWGRMLHDVQYFGAVAEWWWVVPPGLSIAALSLAFVLVGYALDDIFNPKLRGR